MEIRRDIYLNKLISKKYNGLIKVVTGIRRCGKSYLLFNLFKDYLLAEGTDEQHVIEIAFDSFENKRFRDPDVLYPYLKERIKDNKMYYVLLDEVKLLGEFESVLNSLIRMKNVDVYVTALGLDDVYTELLPAGKVDKVEELIQIKPEKGKLAFVGDGINDAPMLHCADIGIAMGSDTAIEVTDVVLMDDDPMQISKAIKISHKCPGIVYQNIVVAIGVKMICLVWIGLFSFYC